MSTDVDRRDIALEFVEPIPEEVDAGAELTLTIRASSASEFDFSNAPFLVTSPGGVRLAGDLPDVIGEEGNVVRIVLAAPDEIGEFAWSFIVPEHEREETVYRQASLPFSFRTRPHAVSLAVWDCPSPVVIGETFSVKVGAQCRASCASLQGGRIEIRNTTGAVIATVALGATPWPETSALYWADVHLTAPATIGLHSWTVKFLSAQLRRPHDEATFSFSFVADWPPEHTVTVQIVEEQTGAPIENAQVRLGAYRLSTDATGLARFAAPNGEHELFFWKSGYEAPPRTVDVTADVSIQIEARVLPVVNSDSYWQG